jgi:hypothetical protein
LAKDSSQQKLEINMNNQVQLFSYTQPDFAGLVQSSRKNDAGSVVAMSLTLQKRKETAKRLGLPLKSDAVSRELLAQADRLQEITVGEIVKMVSSGKWTGAGARASVNKQGQQRRTFSFVSVDRDNKSISPEAMVSALAKMSPEDRKKFMAEAEELNRATINLAPAPAPSPEVGHIECADGLIKFDWIKLPDGNLEVIISSGLEDGKFTVSSMSKQDFDDMVAIAEHNDGEPKGMDLAAVYARLNPILASCPQNLRPIP